MKKQTLLLCAHHQRCYSTKQLTIIDGGRHDSSVTIDSNFEAEALRHSEGRVKSCCQNPILIVHVLVNVSGAFVCI